MSRLALFSLRNRAVVALATVVAVVFGGLALANIKLELIPSLEFPGMAVVASYPGSSPEVVDAQVSAPIEAAARSLDGVVSTTTTSATGLSSVFVELEYGTDGEAARQDLESALSADTAGLPDDVEPEVIAGSIDDFPVIQISVAAAGDLDQLARTVTADVVPLLSGLVGVRDVTVTGAPERRLEVAVDPAALAARGADPTALATTLSSNGVLVPAGALTAGERTLSVQVGTPLTDVADLAALPLAGAPGTTLGDVADVSLEASPVTSIARTDGDPSVSIGITKTPSGNTVDISHAVQEVFDEIEAAVGGDAAVDVVFDQAPFIEQSVEDLTTEGLLGLVFAVVVILVFLLSLRSTLVTAISIPLSVLVTLIGLYVSGYTLNILTLGALTVAIGRVVDDSIVVIENIKRHLSYGEQKSRAILDGVREVAGAVTSSTLATVAVFLPIAIVGGQVGELFRPFALTVTLALLASLLVSLTIIPVLASWFLRAPTGAVDAEQARRAAHDAERSGVLQRAYVPVLDRAVGHPVLTLALAAVLLVGTLAMTPLLKTSFLGDSGQNTVTVTQDLPPGASLQAQDAAARAVEDVVLSVPGIETVQTTVGSGEGIAALFGGSADATFALTTDEDADQEALQDRIRTETARLQDVGTVAIDAGGGFGSSAVEVVVTADDPAVLDAAGTAVLEAVTAVDGARDVQSNVSAAQPTITVEVDREAAAAAGLSDAAVGRSLAGVLQPSPLGSVLLPDGRYDAVLVGGTPPTSLEQLRATPLHTPAGPVPLSQVAAVEEVEVPTSVTRIDGERSITVTTTPDGDDLGAVTADIQAALDSLDLPEGAEAALGGVASDQEEAFAQLGLALLLAIAIVYIVMVATFGSLLQPLILLVSIPFAATGAIGLLLVTGVALGVAALIGMLMLVGIVVTNAIVLIDLVNQHRRRGDSPEVAVREGARQRLRPILMTAAATIMALTPMAFGLTGGSAFISQPLAIVVIGGLVSSTLLTLVLVPVLYLLVERRRARPTTPVTAPSAG